MSLNRRQFSSFLQGGLASLSTLVPAGGSTVVDLTLRVPGNFVLVDHALAHVDKGAWGVLHVTGDPEPGVLDGVVQEMKAH